MKTVKDFIDDLQYLLDKATEDLAKFDSEPAMVQYEAQRQQIFKQAFIQRDSELRLLDAQHKDLLKTRTDLLAQQARADLDLRELKAKYAGGATEISDTR